MTAKTEILKGLRARIDELDDEILELIQRRAAVAIEIGQVKKRHSLAVVDRSREKAVLDRLMIKSQGRPLGGEAVREIFSALVRACRAAQAPIRVAFLGPAGTYSHAAALEQFGALGLYQPQDDLAAVFKEVEEGRADLCVAPFENSIEGLVGQTLDLLGNTGLKARGMVTLKISLALMSRGLEAAAIRKVASHPQALGQARGWLSLNLPGVELVAAASTAAAATMLDEAGASALIGHPALADFHNLNIVADNIEDRPHNQTFFLVMGREHSTPSGRDRTLCWFTAPHRAGSLYSCLQSLADLGVNMTRLHSRPCLDRPLTYRFFLEMDGHFSEDRLTRALDDLKRSAERFHLIGSYETQDQPLASGAGLLNHKGEGRT
ncbi:MAG: chorismate mutase [Deltaproteobacteria bacterium]|nr:chorismate mutase [Deltaproteobacteria bacterium]